MLTRIVQRVSLAWPVLVAGAAVAYLVTLALMGRDDHMAPLATPNHLAKFATASTVADSFVVDNGASGLDVATHQVHNLVDPTSAQDAATQAYVLAHAGGMSIGGAITSGTAKSALFVGAGPVLAQDNTKYRYDTAAGLQLGADAVSAGFAGFTLMMSNASADVVSYTWNTDPTGLGANGWLDPSRGLAGIMGFGNASTGVTTLRNHLFIYDNAKDLVIVDAVSNAIQHRFFDTANVVGYQMAKGDGAPGGASATAKVRYNSVGAPPWSASGSVEYSLNGNTYWPVVMDPVGNQPTITGGSCGTGPTQNGNSRKGSVTPGSGAVGCVIVFANPLTSCNVTWRNGIAGTYAISSATLSLGSGTQFDYDCN